MDDPNLMVKMPKGLTAATGMDVSAARHHRCCAHHHHLLETVCQLHQAGLGAALICLPPAEMHISISGPRSGACRMCRLP